jgi:hypothetical protein
MGTFRPDPHERQWPPIMAMSGMLAPWRALAQEASVAKKKIKPRTTERVIKFAAPYTGLLALFLFVVLLDARRESRLREA